MDCKRVEAELAPFLLAALDGATRAGVEAHLTACARCVGELLAVKRAVDAGEDAGDGPSELARARILRSAEQAMTRLGASVPAPSRSPVQRRRAPRLMVAAALVALGALVPLAWRATHRQAAPAVDAPEYTPPSEPLVAPEQVDTARTTPDSLRFL